MLLARLPDAEILATDISARRLAAMQRRLQRYPYAAGVQTSVLDATSVLPAGKFDLILCDVPCSGTGTLARNPEIRLKLAAGELTRQSERQRAIVQHALQQLTPGGRLVYSTCSLEPEENEEVLADVLASAPVRQLPVQPLLEQVAASGLLTAKAEQELLSTALHGNALRTLPGVHAFDGFYAAVLERN